MSIKVIGKDKSKFQQNAILYEIVCPKCGETLLIRADVQSTNLELALGTKKQPLDHKGTVTEKGSTMPQFRPRVLV